MSQPTVRLEFLGCKLTAYTDESVWLDVAYFAEFLRDTDGTCAFCHADPLAERPCAECSRGYFAWGPVERAVGLGADARRYLAHAEGCTLGQRLIEKEVLACPEYASFETCPCCSGRPT